MVLRPRPARLPFNAQHYYLIIITKQSVLILHQVVRQLTATAILAKQGTRCAQFATMNDVGKVLKSVILHRKLLTVSQSRIYLSILSSASYQ